jgi:hypothetical protein
MDEAATFRAELEQRAIDAYQRYTDRLRDFHRPDHEVEAAYRTAADYALDLVRYLQVQVELER